MFNRHQIISYAQNGEDIVLQRALKDVENGFYVDVGAGDPKKDSVTLSFYKKGWTGINIEPNGEFFERLEQFRPHDFNVKCAIGAEPREMTFEVIIGTGLSTLVEDYATQHKGNGFASRREKVRTQTLDYVLSQYSEDIIPIHFLKIDVEGFEREVLAGLDFNRYRPWIIVYEATKPNSNTLADIGIPNLLETAEYTFSFFDGLNKFYIANERSDLAQLLYPANFLDNYVRADQIASLDEKDQEILSLKTALKYMENDSARILIAFEELTSSLQDKELNLYDAAKALSDLQECLNQKERDLIEAGNAFTDLQECLNQREKDLIEAGKALTNMTNILNEKEAALQFMQKFCEQKDLHIADATKAYEDLRRALESKEAALFDASAAYAALEAHYSKKEL